MLGLFFICIIIALLALPVWPYSKSWGPRVSVIFAIIAVVLLFFFLRSITYVKYEGKEGEMKIKLEQPK